MASLGWSAIAAVVGAIPAPLLFGEIAHGEERFDGLIAYRFGHKARPNWGDYGTAGRSASQGRIVVIPDPNSGG
jgi:hypothetical protein